RACAGRAVVRAPARQAMLATLRGRFDEAAQLIADVAAEGRRAGLPDTERLVGTLHGQIAFYRGPAAASDAADQLWPLARRLPGPFMEATIAARLALTRRARHAQAGPGPGLP